MKVDFEIKWTCHWDKERECKNEMLCGLCEFQPADEDKPNGKLPPKALKWEPSYWNGIEPVCPSCGEMPYSYERCVFCGQKLINTREEREPEYKGATVVKPTSDCGFAQLRCDKCGEIILDNDCTTVSHADGENFYIWKFRHKCGGTFETKHWR